MAFVIYDDDVRVIYYLLQIVRHGYKTFEGCLYLSQGCLYYIVQFIVSKMYTTQWMIPQNFLQEDSVH